MTDASQQQLSHADRHDLDKLARWKEALDAPGLDADDAAEAFPVCAIFLVSPEDRTSHDIFRRYRSVFEELGGGFHHLVIFGQHGVSTTQAAFLGEVGMEQESVPLLALASMRGAEEETGGVYCLELPKGDRDGELDDAQNWGAMLARVCASCRERTLLALDGVDGVTTSAFRRGSLAGAVAGISNDLGCAA